MPCCTTTSTWATNLRIGLESKQYVVQLKRAIGCCHEDYQIFVNGNEMVDHGLTYNPCSPLCCSGGSYEWEQEGHHFQIMYNGVHYRRTTGNFRLFVDGIDVDTGLEFSAFWRRKGFQLLILGLVLMFFGALVYVVVFVVFKVGTRNLGSMSGANVLLCFGIVYCIYAVILYSRYNQPRSYPTASINYQPFKNV